MSNYESGGDCTENGYARGRLALTSSMKLSKDTMDEIYFMTDIARKFKKGFKIGFGVLWRNICVGGYVSDEFCML